MNTITQVRPDRVRCRVAPSALALLESARQGLVTAEGDVSAGGRYVGAHLAALRAAAAIVAARAEPAPPRRAAAERMGTASRGGAHAERVGRILRGRGRQAGRRRGGPAPRGHRPRGGRAASRRRARSCRWPRTRSACPPSRCCRCQLPVRNEQLARRRASCLFVGPAGCWHGSEGLDGAAGVRVQDAPANQFLGQVGRRLVVDDGERAQVLLADRQHPAVVVTALALDGGDVTGKGTGLVLRQLAIRSRSMTSLGAGARSVGRTSPGSSSETGTP